MNHTRRLAAGFTGGELARLVGVSPQAVSYWEAGTHRPRLRLQNALADALGCTRNDLFGAK